MTVKELWGDVLYLAGEIAGLKWVRANCLLSASDKEWIASEIAKREEYQRRFEAEIQKAKEYQQEQP